MSARKLFQSTVGKKVVMAITGIILVVFVIGHMAGNLLVFAGRAEINAYGHLLHASDDSLWGIRSVLIVSVVLHVCGRDLTRRCGSCGSPARLRSQDPADGNPRVANHACGRPGASRVHRVPPAAPHHRHHRAAAFEEATSTQI